MSMEAANGTATVAQSRHFTDTRLQAAASSNILWQTVAGRNEGDGRPNKYNALWSDKLLYHHHDSRVPSLSGQSAQSLSVCFDLFFKKDKRTQALPDFTTTSQLRGSHMKYPAPSLAPAPDVIVKMQQTLPMAGGQGTGKPNWVATGAQAKGAPIGGEFV